MCYSNTFNAKSKLTTCAELKKDEIRILQDNAVTTEQTTQYNVVTAVQGTTAYKTKLCLKTSKFINCVGLSALWLSTGLQRLQSISQSASQSRNQNTPGGT